MLVGGYWCGWPNRSPWWNVEPLLSFLWHMDGVRNTQETKLPENLGHCLHCFLKDCIFWSGTKSLWKRNKRISRPKYGLFFFNFIYHHSLRSASVMVPSYLSVHPFRFKILLIQHPARPSIKYKQSPYAPHTKHMTNVTSPFLHDHLL